MIGCLAMPPPTEPPKSRAQIKREIDEVLARTPGGALAPQQGRWDDSPGAWQRGYEFAQEAALHETRAEQREILQRVAAGARSAYDHGFVAGYQDMLGVSRSKIAPHSIKTFDAPKPSLTVRQINAIVRAADGRNVYLVRRRLDEETVQRVTRARTRGRETEVRSLATGNWLPVLPERGDRLEVR
jgi:hypothetical protein